MKTKITLENLYEGELTEEEWLQDLETTKARQTTGWLGSSKVGFCCLGRACVKDKRIKRKGASRVIEDRCITSNGFVVLATGVSAWSWAKESDLILAVKANDDEGFTFKEIAAWWRAGRPVDDYGNPVHP